MSNFHLEVKNISRCRNKSFVRLVNYITGERLHDNYNSKTFYNKREDVLFHAVLLPDTAPHDFCDLQSLCTKIDQAEKRYDARTAREFIGSLPNELPCADLVDIVHNFVRQNFTDYGLAAIVGIHSGINREDPTKNNPHVHILVSTRTVDSEGFSKHKYREFNNKQYMNTWRESWAEIQNRAYMDRGMTIRVSSDSLYVQGIDREPLIGLSLAEYQLEKRGIHTYTGDKNREIRKRNAERERRKELQRNMYLERSR